MEYRKKQIGTDGSLALNSTGSSNEADYGVRVAGTDDVNLNIGSKLTEINVVSGGKAYGVAAENTESGTYAFNETKVMFVDGGLNESNADVNITAQGQQGANGIYVGNRGSVNIYANLHMQADGE